MIYIIIHLLGKSRFYTEIKIKTLSKIEDRRREGVTEEEKGVGDGRGGYARLEEVGKGEEERRMKDWGGGERKWE